MHRSRIPLRSIAAVDVPPQPSAAERALGAESALQARAEAEREIARGARCACCLSPRIHLFQFFGSTLFLDDQPEQLRQAIPAEERERWSARLIAACIVLFGRTRISVFGERPPWAS